MVDESGPRSDATFCSITLRRAEVLRELADGSTQPEIAARLGISVNSVRSHVEDLRNITGCSSGRDLGRWWRRHRDEWVELTRQMAGGELLWGRVAATAGEPSTRMASSLHD